MKHLYTFILSVLVGLLLPIGYFISMYFLGSYIGFITVSLQYANVYNMTTGCRLNMSQCENKIICYSPYYFNCATFGIVGIIISVMPFTIFFFVIVNIVHYLNKKLNNIDTNKIDVQCNVNNTQILDDVIISTDSTVQPLETTTSIYSSDKFIDLSNISGSS